MNIYTAFQASLIYWTSVAYMDVGKGREQERKLTPSRGVLERVQYDAECAYIREFGTAI